jgi:hypothetical protein
MGTRWLRVGVVGVAAAAACKFTHGNAPGDGGAIDTVDALPDGPAICPTISSDCTSGSGALIVCAAIGSASTTIPCNWGCVGSAGSNAAHCGGVAPAGGAVRGADALGSGFGSNLGSGIDLDTNLIVDGDTGSIGPSGAAGMVRGPGVGVMNNIDFELRGSGSAVAVFRFKRLTVSGPVTLVSRFQHRAVAFVVDGDVTISDVVDARGFCGATDAGPGGFAGGAIATDASGSGNGHGGGNSVGGGGGGYGGLGGTGHGTGTAAGGAIFGDNEISVLVGGGGGGGGGGNANNSGAGGGGGGGFQIVSNTKITIVANGGINAGGCGGYNGMGGADGGGGGGAGGTILLEAPAIDLAGILAVNGGGGGAGNANNQNMAAAGGLGSAAAPGNSGMANGGNGAAGGSADGSPGSANGGHGGAGGGAIGRMRFNTLRNAGLSAGSATLSPALGTTTTQGAATVN